MKYKYANSFKKGLSSLSTTDKRAANKDTFKEITQAIEGNKQLAIKYKLKKMHGNNRYMEGHIKRHLCFVYKFSVESNAKVCIFLFIGTHEIYDQVKRLNDSLS